MDKRQKIMNLWRQNFHDSEEFIQFYFAHKYNNENALVYEENGEVLSALLMLPYPMKWQDTVIQTAYISGACTQEKARNQGFMTKLLQTAFHQMYKRKIALSTLIPAENWLFDHYSKLGYVPVFEYSSEEYIPRQTTFSINKHTRSPQTYDTALTARLFPFFQQKTAEYPCTIVHTPEDYKAIVEETYLSGGRLIYSQIPASGEITGWALAVPSPDKVYLKEILYSTEHEKTTLLETCSKIWPGSSIKYRTPPQTLYQTSYGMARITHASLLLQHIAINHTHLSLTLKLTDPHIPQNTGIYFLSHGKCEKVTTCNSPTDIETDIPTLTQAVLGYRINELPPALNALSETCFPYMNLMLD